MEKIYSLFCLTFDNAYWETHCKLISNFSDLADANEEMTDCMSENGKPVDAPIGVIYTAQKYIPDSMTIVNNDFYAVKNGDLTHVYFVTVSEIH